MDEKDYKLDSPGNESLNNVLIVDEDAAKIKVLSTLLKGKGFNVAVANEGGEAIGYLKEKKYDLIITKFNMPDLDGYKLLDTVKAFYRDYKVMIMSDDMEKRDWLMQRGLLKAFHKPLSLEKFLDELDVFIKERRKTRRFKISKHLECKVTDKAKGTIFSAELLDISVDGVLILIKETVDRLARLELAFSLSQGSKVVYKVTGTVVRIINEKEDSRMVGIYFEDSRDLSLLEQLRPFVVISDE